MSGNEPVTTTMYNNERIHDDTGQGEHLRPRVARRRFIIIFALISAVVVVLIYRFAVLMLGDPSPATLSSRAGTYERGPILDRNGRLIASQPRYTYSALLRIDSEDH